MSKRKLWLLSLVLVLSIISSACAGAANEPNISISEAWGRPSPSSAMTGAFYMVIRNTGAADSLVSAHSEACGMVEIHASSMTPDGVMSMRPMEHGIEIPAGGEVELGPGGLHVMCIDKKTEFTVGKQINLRLSFEKSGSKTVEVKIREP